MGGGLRSGVGGGGGIGMGRRGGKVISCVRGIEILLTERFFDFSSVTTFHSIMGFKPALRMQAK